MQLSAKHKAGASVQDSEASGRMARAWNVRFLLSFLCYESSPY